MTAHFIDSRFGMATLTIRNVDPELREALRVRAARHGRSMEAELRQILKKTLRQVPGIMASEDGLGPGFSPSGPNAKLYGEKEGFPVADHSLTLQPGEPYNVKYRIGAYSHFDEIFPTHRIGRAVNPWMFKRAKADIGYSFRGNRSSVAEYLSRNPVTGLLIAKDDQILFEHYQYGRTDRDRFMSQSMAKSITGMLIGIAIGESSIKSVDDTAETYVPGFKDTEYGKTPILDLLHMSSGVEFREIEDGQRDLNLLSTWFGAWGGRRARSTASCNSTTVSRGRGHTFMQA
jgi:hypothetical protein